MNKNWQKFSETRHPQIADSTWQWSPIVHDPSAELPWIADGTEEVWENAATWRADIDRVNAIVMPKLTKLEKWQKWQAGLEREREQALEAKQMRLDAEYTAIVEGKRIWNDDSTTEP